MSERLPVVLISADTEWKAVLELLQPAGLSDSPLGQFFAHRLGSHGLHFFHGGWGKVSAAATTQYCLDHFLPPFLVNLGTCGGFSGAIERGETILVERTVIYDIIEQMTDPVAAIEHYATRLDLAWLPDPLPHPVRRGLLVSADRDILPADIPMLRQRLGAIAADWESGAIAWVANRSHIPCLILRSVTDLVAETGGEAYANMPLFEANTRQVMKILLAGLPDWLPTQ